VKGGGEEEKRVRKKSGSNRALNLVKERRRGEGKPQEVKSSEQSGEMKGDQKMWAGRVTTRKGLRDGAIHEK